MRISRVYRKAVCGLAASSWATARPRPWASAAEALNLGVVAEVVPAVSAHQRGLAVAHELAAKPHTALRYTREILIAPFRELLHGHGLSHGIAGETLAIHARREELKP